MKIILIGFMGSGKSTVAKILSESLSMPCMDMDDLVIKKSGRSDIKEIFQKDGEISFRELEIIIGKELKKTDNTVISTGGGAVLNKIIFDYLKCRSDDRIIYLKTKFTTLKKRLEEDSKRPLFENIKNAEELYKLRKHLYENYADISIMTDNREKKEVVKEIIKKLKGKI